MLRVVVLLLRGSESYFGTVSRRFGLREDNLTFSWQCESLITRILCDGILGLSDLRPVPSLFAPLPLNGLARVRILLLVKVRLGEVGRTSELQA